MNQSAPVPKIIILCSDILFLSKITGTSDQLGFSSCTAINDEQALQQISDERKQVILIDLNLPNLAWDRLSSILHAKPNEIPSNLVSIAFGPHVEPELFKKAKAAGCTQVLPRSQFSAQLPQLLKAALTTEP